MPFTIASPAVVPVGPDAVAVPGSPAIANLTPRALHARLLANAALRRQRGLQRREEHRMDDAAYWINAAFSAVTKAAETRRVAATLP
ncbi:hypothetical protein [uncultured Brevundimonas sp.]|uniref:hypothetical protein n=1 Tax=uncultured Brevundimonas sp. TaxID=213418 RepID=UPI0026310BE7|nr:hypothetical protein [uncultured Brevundimonas sp.]